MQRNVVCGNKIINNKCDVIATQLQCNSIHKRPTYEMVTAT